jgi:hypothetical protein
MASLQQKASFYQSILLKTILLAAPWLCTEVLADLPVHCLRSEVAGDWDFELTEPSYSHSACGHKRPDIEEGQPNVSFVGS